MKLVVILLLMLPAQALAQRAGVDSVMPAHPVMDVVREGTSVLRVPIPTSRDDALERAANLLEAAGYVVDHENSRSDSVTTRFRYVRGVGLVRVSLVTRAMDTGTVLELRGESRRLRRVLVLSAAGPIERIAYTTKDARRRAAWDALTQLADAIAPEPIATRRLE